MIFVVMFCDGGYVDCVGACEYSHAVHPRPELGQRCARWVEGQMGRFTGAGDDF